MQNKCTSHFLSYPFFPFWQLLKKLLGKGTRCCLSKPSFTPSSCAPLPASMVILASSRHIMRGKKKILSHFHYISTPSKVEGSTVIFYLLVYTLRWGIKNALSFPSRIKRSACPLLRWNRDLKQRKNLAYPRYDPLSQAILFCFSPEEEKAKSCFIQISQKCIKS